MSRFFDGVKKACIKSDMIVVIGGFIMALVEALIAMLEVWGRHETVAIYFLVAAGITG